MNIYAGVSLVALVVTVGIGLYVLKKDFRREINIIFFALMLSFGLWDFSEFMIRTTSSKAFAEFWLYPQGFGVFLFPSVYLHLTSVITGTWRNKRFLLYIFFPILLILLLQKKIVSGVEERLGVFTFVKGEFFLIALFYILFLCLLGFYLLVRFYFEDILPENKNRIKFAIFGSLIPIFFGTVTDVILPIFEVSILSFSSLYIAIGSIVVSYGILKHKMFEIVPKREISTKSAPCGAYCYDCHQFIEGECLGCFEGNRRLEEKCKIFLCVEEKDIENCYHCPEHPCKTYLEIMKNCPVKVSRWNLEFGFSYMVEEELGYEIFVDLMKRGWRGLWVTRQFPEKLREKYKIKKTPILWLSLADTEFSVDPSDLQKLKFLIVDFIKKTPECVVLLDGIEYLVTQNTFLEFLRFLQSLNDVVAVNECRMLVAVDSKIFSERELSFIKKELLVYKKIHRYFL